MKPIIYINDLKRIEDLINKERRRIFMLNCIIIVYLIFLLISLFVNNILFLMMGITCILLYLCLIERKKSWSYWAMKYTILKEKNV